MRYTAVFLWVFLAVVPTQAHPRVDVSGTVLDAQTDKPLPGVNVVLVGVRQGAVADQNGRFLIKGAPAGDVTLRASLVGFRTVDVSVVVREGMAPVVMRLEERPLQGEEMVVTATRTERFKRDVPVIVNVVDDGIFEATQSVSLAEGLIFQPGLRVETNCQNCGFSQVRLNGMPGGYSQILIDGRPIFSALDGVYGLDQIPAAMIDRVEVVRGGGSALYGGNAIAGTVNVITREPINTGFEVSTSQAFIGSEPDRNVSVNTSFVRADQLAGLSIFGVVRDRNPYDHDGDGFSEITLLKNRSVGVRGFYRTGPMSKATVEVHRVYENRRGGNRFEFEPHEADIAEALTHRVWGGSFAYETLLATDRLHMLSAYVAARKTDRDSYYGTGRDPDAYGFTENRTLSGGAKYSLGTGRSEWTFGLDAQTDRLEDAMPAYDRLLDQTVNLVGVYAQNEYRVSDPLSVLFGLRMDAHSMMDDPVWNPRLNALYRVTDQWQVRASGAMGFRAPQAFDEDLHIESVGGEALLIHLTPDLGPERSHSFSTSLDYSNTDRILPYGFTLEGFYTRLRDPFILEEGPQDADGNKILLKKNGDGAVVKGITLDARLFFSRKLEFQGGLTVQSSLYDAPVAWADGLFSNQILRTPNVYGYYTAIYQAHPNFGVSVSGIYTGPMYAPHYAGYIAEDRLEKTPSFWETNVKFDVDVALGARMPELELQFGVQNLWNQYQRDFDRGEERDAGYVYGPGRPRTFYLGFNVAY